MCISTFTMSPLHAYYMPEGSRGIEHSWNEVLQSPRLDKGASQGLDDITQGQTEVFKYFFDHDPLEEINSKKWLSTQTWDINVSQTKLILSIYNMY